ncbi:conserved hypothetical protein [Burkholderia cenocepacia]|nr:conserved hypothetical protein [Burkholderia cenocepacia]
MARQQIQVTLGVRFFRTARGHEPVREWLNALGRVERRAIGEEIKTVQLGWPLGMLLVRKMAKDLWEIRVTVPGAKRTRGVHGRRRHDGAAARLLQAVAGHAVGRSRRHRRAPENADARHLNSPVTLEHTVFDGRAAGNAMHLEYDMTTTNNPHIGSGFDAFLEADGNLEAATATAIKRVIAWQIGQEMKAQQITKTAMAARMKTSRAALNRLLDETDTSLTLATLASAAAALGKRLSFELVPA